MRWMLFVHIASVAFWLGGAAALWVLYLKSKRPSAESGLSLAYDTTRSVVTGILNPSAVLVLLTGIGMMIQLGIMGRAKPFWLAFMEQFGGLVAIISAVTLTWQIRRLDKASSDQERTRLWRLLNRTIAGIGAGVIVTIFVVALRL